MRILIIVMGLALLLVGCAMPDTEYLEYTGDAFVAEIEGERGGFTFTAKIRVGAPTGGSADAPPRDIEMTFTSPATMKGIVIERIGGKITLSSAGLSIEGRGAVGWLTAAELLTPLGTINDIKIIDDRAGARLAKVEMSLTDGSPLILLIDCDTGFPVNIKNENIEMRIASFGDARK